jgi:hypothetical protein
MCKVTSDKLILEEGPRVNDRLTGYGRRITVDFNSQEVSVEVCQRWDLRFKSGLKQMPGSYSIHHARGSTVFQDGDLFMTEGQQYSISSQPRTRKARGTLQQFKRDRVVMRWSEST